MNDEWFDLLADFGKIMKKSTTISKSRNFLNALEIFLNNSNNPSDLLDVLSYSLKDSSFKSAMVASNIKLIERINAQNYNSDLNKIKELLKMEKVRIQENINESEVALLLFPELYAKHKLSEDSSNTVKNENCHEEYNEYFDEHNDNVINDTPFNCCDDFENEISYNEIADIITEGDDDFDSANGGDFPNIVKSSDDNDDIPF